MLNSECSFYTDSTVGRQCSTYEQCCESRFILNPGVHIQGFSTNINLTSFNKTNTAYVQLLCHCGGKQAEWEEREIFAAPKITPARSLALVSGAELGPESLLYPD